MKGPIYVGGMTRIEDGVTIVGPSMIGPSCCICEGSTIDNSIIFDYSLIGPGGLWLDVSSGCLIEAEDTCLIKKSNHSTSIIILDENHSYYKTITQKLHWASSLNDPNK